MTEDLRAVAAAIFSKDNSKVLAIKRPDDLNDSLAGLWGLPARVLKNEEEIIAARKIGPEKLGTEIEPLERLGELQGQRALGILTLGLWKCDMSGIPDFSRRVIINPDATQYTAWAWKNPRELVVSAERGSLCSSILLNHLNISYGSR
ncbi:conserved hypothetical protein [Candidatus Roizmanbacteria bacterium]|nr:conserved hypothetical protein [Candidatus Roizmanbacteria bacterium]